MTNESMIAMVRNRQALLAARERTGNPKLAVQVRGGAFVVVEVTKLPNGTCDVLQVGAPLPLEMHLYRLENWGLDIR